MDPIHTIWSRVRSRKKNLEPFLDLCVSSLRRGHANLLCIVPILTGDFRRNQFSMFQAFLKYSTSSQFLPPERLTGHKSRWHESPRRLKREKERRERRIREKRERREREESFSDTFSTTATFVSRKDASCYLCCPVIVL